ncbi:MULTISPECIES: DUF6334 family protein [Nostoc]|uniref:Uncharacterized protein n=1 Tax=Nostoc paludosum FACHB-159 TaxID=2692908 RepID=A0ABR8K4C9_9NOSO|nr:MULTISPECIES: DUF6334 family protein [Nostoc]MBD2678054.1 hypothetical protein [Nostoc sp. FACHB-857]MBD2734312.1 hypothetical protein [Nostoc paludosum FACHB-159]
MAINEFPIGQRLIGVSTIRDVEYEGDELCLDEVNLYLEDTEHKITVVTLLPIADTDEIKVIIEEAIKENNQVSAKSYNLLPSLALGVKLMSVWVCENVQGYQDQVIFAFETLHPTITFLAEGSVIKVFMHEQVYKKENEYTKAIIEATEELAMEMKNTLMNLNQVPENSPNQSKIVE